MTSRGGRHLEAAEKVRGECDERAGAPGGGAGGVASQDCGGDGGVVQGGGGRVGGAGRGDEPRGGEHDEPSHLQCQVELDWDNLS